jgi:Flp pilus assembly pilin Flp
MLRKAFSPALTNDSGAAAIEFALLATLFSVAAVVLSGAVDASLSGLFAQVAEVLEVANDSLEWGGLTGG